MTENRTSSGTPEEIGSYSSIDQLLSVERDGAPREAVMQDDFARDAGSGKKQSRRRDKKEKPKKKRRLWLVILGRLLVLLLVFIVSAAALIVSAAWVVVNGPSPTMRDKLVATAMETSAAKFAPRMFLSEEEIEAILNKNNIIEFTEVTEPVKEF